MSRSIDIGYLSPDGQQRTDIEIRAPYFLLGTQQTSLQFWSLPTWGELGVTELAQLGHTDPVDFIGWEMMDTLAKEIRLFQENIERIDFYPEIKASWLAHLIYCHSLLIMTAPRDSKPMLTIG